MTPCYLYILWAAEDELVKIGITSRINKRVSDHNGNSSNPLKFIEWKLYQFSDRLDAHKIENAAKVELHTAGFGYREKRELFECAPTEAATAIERALQKYSISCLRNFPSNAESALRVFADFPSMPSSGLDVLNDSENALYWRGARDALLVLSYFDGMTVDRSDFLRLQNDVRPRPRQNSELWSIISDYYRNQSRCKQPTKGDQAHEALKEHQHQAFACWQNENKC